MADNHVDYFSLINERKEKMRNDKWHKSDVYFDEQKFEEFVDTNMFKEGMSQKTIGEIKQLLCTKYSFVEFSKCDEKLIPFGRKSDYADRDYKFFVNTQNALEENLLKNCLFVNYTGHCGSVGAALAIKGVPLIWNLKISEDAWAEKRIVGQLQDYYQELSAKSNDNLNSFGLMLECPHGDFETFEITKFPSVEFLKTNTIEKICIFVEEEFGKVFDVENYDFLHQEFKNYISNLKKEFEVCLLAVDESVEQKNLHVKKQKIKDVSVYHSNFNCERVD